MLRALFCALPAFALAANAQGQGAGDCDSLPESRRALCVMVQACTTLADEERRLECLRVAAESLVGAEDLAVKPESDGGAPTVVAEAEQAEQAEGATSEATASAGPEQPATAAVPAVEASDAGGGSATAAEGEAPTQPSRTRRALRELFSAPPPAPDAPVVPKRFAAEVTAHRDLVRDRQLLVLDGLLLFEGDRAASSRISVGDLVQVVKSSSMRGRRYQITGPSKRRFDALRIRCEERDLNADNRRKCERMLDR